MVAEGAARGFVWHVSCILLTRTRCEEARHAYVV
jgi:hypothetical protein